MLDAIAAVYRVEAETTAQAMTPSADVKLQSNGIPKSVTAIRSG